MELKAENNTVNVKVTVTQKITVTVKVPLWVRLGGLIGKLLRRKDGRL